MGTWFMSLVRGLFVLIDKIVLWAIETLYGLITDISTVRIFSDANLGEFSSRIATILSVFMLFKLSFSFLNYIINPDQMTDKSKGFSKIIQNVAVSLVLLTTYQFLFDKALDLQMAIINNNTIPKLIMGNNVGNETLDSNSNALSYNLFTAFIRPNTTLVGVCDKYSLQVTDECSEAISGYTGNFQMSSGYGNSYYAQEPGTQLAAITKNKNTWALFDLMIPLTQGDVFLFDYKFLLSTICGAVVALLLLSFCIDISIRMIKFGFLNLIAPIPIISYIDPNKGEGIFKKWLSTVGKTYADLFIRIIAIWFALYIIQILSSNQMTYRNNEDLADPFMTIFIIIGALMFAKQFPKLIQDITGFNFDSKLQLNPFKKIGENALGGKAAGKIIGGTRGMLGGAIAGAKAGREAGGAGGRGMVIGALGGVKRGFSNPKGAFSNTMRERYKDLTGNEMARLSLSSMFLNSGGKGQKIQQERKNLIGKAYGQRNNYESQLTAAQHNTALSTERLINLGVTSNVLTNDSDRAQFIENLNIRNRDLSKQKTQITGDYTRNKMRLEEKIETINKNSERIDNEILDAQRRKNNIQKNKDIYESAVSEYNELQNNKSQYYTAIVGPDNEPLLKSEYTNKMSSLESVISSFENDGARPDFETQLETAERLLEQKQQLKEVNQQTKINAEVELNQFNAQYSSQIQNIDDELSANVDIVNNIAAFEQSKEEETRLRKAIADKDLQIKTLQKDLQQIQQFYHIDPAPPEKVEDAIRKVNEES